MINSDKMKHTCHSKGCPNSHINTQCSPSGSNAGMYSHRASFSNPYITAHSPSLPLLHLRHSSFYNPSVASPTSQFTLQPFFLFSYVTRSSLSSPGEPSTPFTATKRIHRFSVVSTINEIAITSELTRIYR